MTLFVYSLSILAMILLPVLLAVWLRRRYVVAWFLFCVGLAAFVLSQLYHLPLNEWLADVGLIGPIAPDAPHLLRTAVVLGLSAALCETLARVVAFWLLFRLHRAEQFADGVMVGLGHGGIEAMLFGAVLTAAGLTSLLALRGVDPDTFGLTAAQVTAVTQQLQALQGSPLIGLAPFVERCAAISLHVVASVLVWLSFKRRNGLYILAAILFHTLFDTLAVLLPQYLQNVWLIEGVFVLLAGVGLLWLWRIWPREPQPERHLNTPRTDLALFGTAVIKEMQHQWRTRRVLVVAAIFLVFGLTSPLLAKFTPQLLTSIEGAEQFAALIPEPTTADAVAQYIENITQFGFILVIVLGMGAVAGEKERGTAVMILSKPLPRWSFLLSKLITQGAVFGLALLLAALGAYYYTAVLFGGLAFGPFLLGNVLLWLWLMVLATVTLLGSTIADSTVAAAGIAFVGAVILLLAGSLPHIGPLMPSGLVAWASQLGLETATSTTLSASVPPTNGGALVMAIVLIVVLIITSMAVFEQQEL
ncbi:MAG: YhfC family intramembrane metalloprotease [Anaerolineae bacterium]|nr:YhfC family intramembrane metalloprotease [Anaerolineae bacterium]